MASTAPTLLHGFINNTHTTNVTAFYLPQNLPTPWPLVTASVILTLVLSCYGLKPALLSWTEQGEARNRGELPGVRQTWLQTFRERRANYRAGIGKPIKSRRRVHPAAHESELEDLHKPDEAHAHASPKSDPITCEERENYLLLRRKLGVDEDDIGYKGKVDDDGISKLKQNVGDDDIAYGLAYKTAKKGKEDGDDGASKYTASDTFVDADATTLHESMIEIPKSPKWQGTTIMKIVMIIICAYCTFRAVISFSLAIAGLINNKTPAPAASLLLLLLISIQIFLSNRSLPRLLTLIYTLSAVLTSITLLIVAYAPLTKSTSLPRYGGISLSGGNCPVPASDCQKQSTHWSVLGCANYTYFQDLENDAITIPESKFYVPYRTSGDMNLSANALHIVETVVFVMGTIWLLTVALHVYEARHLFVGPAVWSNLLRPQGPGPQMGKHRMGHVCTSMVACLGIFGALIAAVMSIAGHISQATGTPSHSMMYLDSLGPGTWANFTKDSHGYVNGTGYGGNSTIWNDCFTVEAPTIGTGWGVWAAQNGAWEVVRIVAGL